MVQSVEVSSASRKAAILIIAVCFGLSLLLTALNPSAARPQCYSPALLEYIEARGPFRPFEARLSGPWRYAPFEAEAPPPTLTLGDLRESKVRRLILLEDRIRREAETDSSPESAAAYGQILMIGGRFDEARQLLERAVEENPEDSRTLNDLSVTLQLNFEWNGSPEKLLRAVETIQRATESRRPEPSAFFNLAKSLSRLSLTLGSGEALAAYLRLDPESAWTEELKESLSSRSPSIPPLEKQPLNTDAEALQFAEADPQTAREIGEGQLLAQWAKAHLSDELPLAAVALNRLERLGQALKRVNGEDLLLEAVQIIRHLSNGRAEDLRELAGAHLAFEQARQFYSDYQIESAVASVRRAQRAFASIGTPFLFWADFYAALCRYQSRDYREALSALTTLEQRLPEGRYRSLRGRVLWMKGLVKQIQREIWAARRFYQSSLELFQDLGEQPNAASVHHLLAENLENLGRREEAWKHRLEAFAHLPEIRSWRRRHSILGEASAACNALGLPRLSVHFQDEVVALSRIWGNPVATSTAHLFRAEIQTGLGRRKRAEADLAAARRLLQEVPDPKLREGILADLLTVEGKLLSLQIPASAVGVLTDSIQRLERSGQFNRIQTPLLARSLAHLRSGQTELGRRDLTRAFSIAEAQREIIKDRETRRAFFERVREVADLLVPALAEAGQIDSALIFVEKARARNLLEDLDQRLPNSAALRFSDPTSIGNLLAALDRNEILIEYFAARNQVLIFALSRDGVQLTRSPGSRQALDRAVREYVAVLRGRREGDARSLGADLHVQLVSPVEAVANGAEKLVFIPDGALHQVPFAALVNPDTGRFLIEERVISNAPSALSYASLAKAGRGAVARSRRSVLLLGAAEGGATFEFEPLPAAGIELDRVAEHYPLARRISGADFTAAAALEEFPRHPVVHVAAHTIVDVADPELSRLAFGPGSKDDSQELLARQLYGLNFPDTRLVALSSCRTGMGRIDAVEGVASVARVFLANGIPSVLATLWSIDDRQGADFMAAFHSRFARGESATQAFQSAARAAIQAGPANQPPHWAAFQLTGDSSLERRASPLEEENHE